MARAPTAKPKAPAKAKAPAVTEAQLPQVAGEEATDVVADAGDAAPDALIALLNDHGAHMAEVGAGDVGLRVKCHAPHSIERFVAAAQAHPQVHDVRVHASHIELDFDPAALAAETAD